MSTGNLKAFYRSQTWQRARAGYIAYRVAVDGGLCEVCGLHLGKVVHHKTWLTEANYKDPAISLAWSNFRYECQDCHNKERDPAKPHTGRILYGPDGEIIRNPWGPDSPHSSAADPARETEQWPRKGRHGCKKGV